MRYLLDTNVLSETLKRRPDEQVLAWLESQSPLDVVISVLTLGELAKGVAMLPPGARRSTLEGWIRHDLPRQFIGRVVGIDARVAREWGRLTAEGSAHGRPLPVVDGLLLATARVHGLALVTRNDGDCVDRGVETVNPWAAIS